MSSVNALLNPADYIARPTEAQQPAQLTDSHTQNSATDEQTDLFSSKEQSTSSQSQIETGALSRKRKRICLSPSIDLPISQQTIGIAHSQGTVTENSISGGTNFDTSRYIAEMPMLSKLEPIIGIYLFRNLQQEKRNGRFTKAVCLQVPDNFSRDFLLEIWLCSSTKPVILQMKIGLFEDLRNILGDYLFEGMNTSNRRVEELAMGKADHTDAFKIICGNENDCKIEVLLSFDIGQHLYKDCFLSFLTS